MNVKSALELFSISKRWIDYNIISEVELLRYAELSTAENVEHNIEHYPLFILGDYLKRSVELNDNNIHNYIEVVESDIDEGMKDEALVWLLNCLYLTDKQFEMINDYILSEGYQQSRTIKKARLLRKIAIGKNIKEIVIECVESGESTIQNRLLDSCELSEEVLRILVELGSNKRIRNIARDRLKRFENNK